MVTRRPLVLVTGALQELPVGDSVAGATGGSSTTGTATVDFTSVGLDYLTVVVTDAGVASTTQVMAWIAGSNSQNDAIAHLLAARLVSLNVIPATGSFTIHVHNPEEFTGQFTIQWRY